MKNLKTVKPGKTFIYGGVEWAVLGKLAGNVLCLAKGSIGNKAFDKENKNNWKNCSLRKYLNGEFLHKLVENGASADAFIPMELDLTANDGLDDYGTSMDKIGLISCDQYRKYRKVIPQLKDWWWTITPFSTEQNGYANCVRFVGSGASLYNFNAYSGTYGVRPLCVLDSSILVSTGKA